MKQFNPRSSAALVMLALVCAPLVIASPVMASGEAARAPARAEDAGQTILTVK